MREYKFRGKTVESGEWVYGNLLSGKYRTFIENNQVIPETVGQFTEIEDFYKNEICEGDICKIWVMGMEQKESYVVESVGQLHVDMNQADSYFEISRIIRLGNIHDNPELLEV